MYSIFGVEVNGCVLLGCFESVSLCVIFVFMEIVFLVCLLFWLIMCESQLIRGCFIVSWYVLYYAEHNIGFIICFMVYVSTCNGGFHNRSIYL